MAACYPDNTIWPDPTVLDDFTEEQLEVALALAWGTLQALSGYAIAICPVTVRPCKPRCNQGSYFIDFVTGPGLNPPFWPRVINGTWINVWCGHRGDCSCVSIQEVILPGTVGDVVEVVIDGVALDPADYRVDNGNRLVRQDGGGWPACQNMNLPMGEEGTFYVTYYSGATADVTVRWAAGILAVEYLAAITGGECRLPAGTVQIVRQGITIEVEKNMFENGRTGLPDVDGVIGRFNPYGLKTPPQVFSLDRRPARLTTWQSPGGS